MIEQVDVALVGSAGDVIATLTIRCLPGRTDWQGQALLRLAARSSTGAAVQLLEESEYEFAVVGLEETVTLEPVEIFDVSSRDGRYGRIRTRRWTGTVEVAVVLDGLIAGRGEVEVRSRKLQYESEYKWMLNGITSYSAELAQQAFAPAQLAALEPAAGTASTLYQRFAFVQSFVQSTEFRRATQAIVRRPHHDYRPLRYDAPVARGVRLDRHASRQLTQPGRRVRLPSGTLVAGMDAVPERLLTTEHVESLDTVPNRFVRHAIVEWAALADDITRVMDREDSAFGRRGSREAAIVRDELDEVARSKVLADVGRLAAMPVGNTVLQGRSGYRELFRAFLQADAASKIEWDGGKDLFAAGQVDVAALYEYWVFLELARIVGSIPGVQLSHRRLLWLSSDSMRLRLQRGGASVVKGTTTVLGQSMRLDLWFNRQFRPSKDAGSWTVSMRPDCSLRIRRLDRERPMDRWVHFDAKYRLDRYQQVLDDSALSLEDTAPAPASAKPVNDDLLKMHAYRDAIRRSSGAFVLYPGFEESPTILREYHEILPGLGAFVLRPADDGHADEVGTNALRLFVCDLIEHTAAAGTDEERADYWSETTYRQARGRRLRNRAPGAKPAADTTTLLGFVRSLEHRSWIRRLGLYNLRADDRAGAVGLRSPQLGADVVVLYSMFDEVVELVEPTGSIRVLTAAELRSIGYPNPRGDLYCCLEVRPTAPTVELPPAASVRALARALSPTAIGAPVVASWLDLARRQV